MIVAFSVTEQAQGTMIDEQFARAEAFIIYNTEEQQGFKKLENREAQETGHGAGMKAVSLLCEQGVDCIITMQCGPKAKQALEAAGIKLHITSEKTLEGALKDYTGS